MAKKKKEETKEDFLDGLEPEISLAIKEINKKYGDGSIQIGTDVVKNVEVIPTSSLALDEALGVGGIPKGSIVEIYGSPGVGKTTLALEILIEAQKTGEWIGIVDMENSLYLDYADRLGLNREKIMFAQPGSAEEALDDVDVMIKTEKVKMIMIDSVAALVPLAELEGKVEDQHIGRQARLMSQFLRRISPIVNKTGCTVIFINQTRQKIGMYGGGTTTPGGNALKFHSQIRIEISPIEQIKDTQGVQIGTLIKARIVKNKFAPPYRVAQFELIFGEGIDQTREVLELAILDGCINKNGACYYYLGELVARGRESMRGYLNDNPDILAEIKEKVLGDSENISN
ncbi:MAG: recombinase RecA [Phycisphaerae bacterium]